MEIKVRRAELGDVHKILVLLRQVYAVHAKDRPDLFPKTGENAVKYGEGELTKLVFDDKRPIFVGIDENGEVRGYCFCELQNHIEYKTLYIDDLCVDEASRKMRVGQTLYEYVLEYARSLGCHNVTLNVWEKNDAARAFYDKMGLKPQKTTLEQIL